MASPMQEETPIHVVAVDDDEVDRAILVRFLSRLTGPPLVVTIFADPEDALAHVSGARADVLLVDYQIGTSSGVQFLERVRELGVLAPAILMTGQGDEMLAVRAIHAGFADYLPKEALSERSLERSMLNALEKHRLAMEAQAYRAELERTVRDLEGKNREIASFYHTLAHELKTPLTAAREFAAIIKDELIGPVAAEQQELLGSVIRSCDQVRRCIDDLFDVSRLDTGKLNVVKVPGKLDDVASLAVRSLRPQAEELGVELVQEVLDELPVVGLDEQRILQVVTNLIGNALKFTERGGRVVVSCAKSPAGDARVTVRDNGCGIASEDLGVIFERLYQVEGHAAVTGGLGLGLHLCRELVRMHGGEITAQSEVGAGSTFEFTLPRA